MPKYNDFELDLQQVSIVKNSAFPNNNTKVTDVVRTVISDSGYRGGNGGDSSGGGGEYLGPIAGDDRTL